MSIFDNILLGLKVIYESNSHNWISMISWINPPKHVQDNICDPKKSAIDNLRQLPFFRVGSIKIGGGGGAIWCLILLMLAYYTHWTAKQICRPNKSICFANIVTSHLSVAFSGKIRCMSLLKSAWILIKVRYIILCYSEIDAEKLL